MKRVDGKCQILTEEEFFDKCTFAKKVLNYVEKNENSSTIKWFFKQCYADFDEGKYNVEFRSWTIPGYYEDYSLVISVQKLSGEKYEIKTINKNERKMAG